MQFTWYCTNDTLVFTVPMNVMFNILLHYMVYMALNVPVSEICTVEIALALHPGMLVREDVLVSSGMIC